MTQERRMISIMPEDTLTLTNAEGVVTTYVVDRLEGDSYYCDIVLRNPSVPEPEIRIPYGKTD